MFIARVFVQVHERKATKKDGTEFTFKYQEAEMLREGHRPRVIRISVPNQGRYEEGLYTLSADSFRPDKYERLEMGFAELTPLETALKEAEKQQKAWQGRKLVKNKRASARFFGLADNSSIGASEAKPRSLYTQMTAPPSTRKRKSQVQRCVSKQSFLRTSGPTQPEP